MTASDWGPDSPADDPVPADASAAGATNTAPGYTDPGTGAGERGDDLRAGEGLRRATRERIRAERVARGWTQAELASRVQRSHTTVSHWETGARPAGLDDLGDLAEAFGLDPWTLIIPGGLVPVSQDDATVERVAAVLAAWDGQDWADLRGRDVDASKWASQRCDHYRRGARAAVRALREAGSDA